jgi:hypothetical protein
MKKSLLYFSGLALIIFLFSCQKDTVPGTIPGTWKLILQGNDNPNHRIDTFELTRTKDSVLQEFITFNSDYKTGTLELKGMGLDSDNVYSYMDSTYQFNWIYFNSGPEIWIQLLQNPRRRFTIWNDSANIHLNLNYQDKTYLCDYYINVLNDSSIQQIFQKQP